MFILLPGMWKGSHSALAGFWQYRSLTTKGVWEGSSEIVGRCQGGQEFPR